MSKRVVKRSKSASASPPPLRVVKDAREHPEAADEVILKGDPAKPAERLAKVAHFIVSVGDDGRDESYEDFVARVIEAIGVVPYGEPGTHTVNTGGHYILDGKVCLVPDFDEETQTFKKGAVPPTWAGGPKTSTNTVGTMAKQMEWDREALSSDEYDKKYRIGKYTPKPRASESSAEHDARMRKMRADKLAAEEAELEEFDWDIEDVGDEDMAEAVVKSSASAAVKKMKGKSKRTVKRKGTETGDKPPTKKKRVVKK